MHPRIVYRTHYQVAEPAYLEILVKSCTSPVQSAYPERVAEKLAREITHRGRIDNPRFGFNSAAARFALDLARGLGILTGNNTWSDKGHLVNLMATTSMDSLNADLVLSARERLLHFRLFLDGDGAALLHIARHILDEGRIRGQVQEWNDFGRQMLIEVYERYLMETSNTADRLTLRRDLDRLKARPFSGKTGCHKSFLHLQVLYRIGLFERVDAGGHREYRPGELGTEALRTLLCEIPSVHELERVAENADWARVAAAVLYPDARRVDLSTEDVLGLIIDTYRRITSTGVPLCSLTTLIDAAQIEVLAEREQFTERSQILDVLVQAQQEKPREVRFHVDRKGRPAFLKLSDGFLS